MNAPGNHILEYTPEDMTVVVGAGMTLVALQAALSEHRQWLPIDPPGGETVTIGKIINDNLSGPRRFGYGTIRDQLIGITVKMADGSIVHSGGKVVKNVAGYDLLKLFVGAKGSLGTVLDATFKLRPLPEAERFVQAKCASLEQAESLIEAIVKTSVTPVIIDLHNSMEAKIFCVVLGFAGSTEEVAWQLEQVAKIGFVDSASLDYVKDFWNDEKAPVQRVSVLPSKLSSAIKTVAEVPFVARAGNGVIYHRGEGSPPDMTLPTGLMRRVKEAFDPKNVLPEFSL